MSDAFERMTSPRVLPPEFRRAPTLRAFWRSQAEVTGGLDDVRAEAVATQAEMFVRQVTGRPEPGMTWRLSQIEEEMGLPDGELVGLSDAQRRDRIIARLRSWRLPTAFAIRTIAQAYAGMDVQTVMDYEAHNITVRFTGSTMDPQILADLEAEIVRIMPARLGPIYFVFTFTTWGDLYQWEGTWERLFNAGVTWEDLYQKPRSELPAP